MELEYLRKLLEMDARRDLIEKAITKVMEAIDTYWKESGSE
jgi:hypothetical protein